MAKEFDFSFIKDESGIEDVKDTKKEMLVISKEDFIERVSNVSKQLLEDLENTAKENNNPMSPMALMSEMLTHVTILAKITNELFKEGE